MSDDALSRREFIRGATGAAALVGAAGTAAAQEQTATGTGTANGTASGTGTATGTAGTQTGTANGTGTQTGTANGPGTGTGNGTTEGEHRHGNPGTGNGTGTGGTGTGGGTGTSGGGGGGGGGGTEEVIVGPGGNLTFEPADLEITPGTTVKWVWESDTHNVIPEAQPDGSSWEGTPGGEGKTYDTGYTYSHTFDTEGSYDYFCAPHKSAGMVASISVSEDAGGGGGGGGGPAVPDSAKTLGVATMFAMMATLTLAFFFLKYGGDTAVEE